MQTIAEAKAFLRNYVHAEGTRCPCCKQFVKAYKRRIHSKMARDLISLRALECGTHDPNGVWIPSGFRHYSKFCLGHPGDLAKFKYWGILEEAENLEGNKRCSGFWRITETGFLFVQGQMKVDKYKVVYDGKVLRSEGPVVSITDCLGNKYNYQELMGGH